MLRRWVIKCERNGCPDIIVGGIGWASVFNELRAKTDPTYTKPEPQAWCLKCYQYYEAHKYTYVELLPKVGEAPIRTKRVPRLDDAGKPYEEPAVDVKLASPIDESIPSWAKSPDLPPPPKQEPVRSELIDAAGLPIKRKIPKKKVGDESPVSA